MKTPLKIFALLGLLGIALTVWAGGARVVSRLEPATLSVVTTGDTAQVVKVRPRALDSFVYLDSFKYQADTGVAQLITMTTDAKRVKITPTTAIESFTYTDSIVGIGLPAVEWVSPQYEMQLTPTFTTGGTYMCTVVYASGARIGFNFDTTQVTSGGSYDNDSLVDDIDSIWNQIAGINDSIQNDDSATYILLRDSFSTETHGGRWTTVISSDMDTTTTVITTVTMVVDSMVIAVNAAANVTDSVVAEDSATYYIIKNDEPQPALEGGWSVVVFGEDGDNQTVDSAQDTTTSYEPSVQVICSTFAALINADAGLDSFVTAANSGDTVYTVTSDDNGVQFFLAVFGGGVADSAQDTVYTQTNVTSYSAIQDTAWVGGLANSGIAYDGIIFRAIIDSIPTANQGMGLSDSGYIWLYTTFADEWHLIAVDTQASLPCTLRYVQEKPYAGGSFPFTDTLLKEELLVVWRIADSASDTTATLPYEIQIDYILTDD